MDDQPVNTASHILLWICVLGITVWLVWSATHSTTNNDKFAPGSAQISPSFAGLRLFDLYLGCIPLKGEKPNVNKNMQ
jgi:hypothetical protein